jgi:hypothetical protein
MGRDKIVTVIKREIKMTFLRNLILISICLSFVSCINNNGTEIINSKEDKTGYISVNLRYEGEIYPLLSSDIFYVECKIKNESVKKLRISGNAIIGDSDSPSEVVINGQTDIFIKIYAFSGNSKMPSAENLELYAESEGAVLEKYILDLKASRENYKKESSEVIK